MNLTGRPIYQKDAKPVVSKTLRNAARGRDCTLRLDGCRNDRETVVLCHLRMFNTAGMAQKPHDALAVFACAHCHRLLDRADTSGTWGYEDVLRGLIATLSQQIASGHIEVKP